MTQSKNACSYFSQHHIRLILSVCISLFYGSGSWHGEFHSIPHRGHLTVCVHIQTGLCHSCATLTLLRSGCSILLEPLWGKTVCGSRIDRM